MALTTGESLNRPPKRFSTPPFAGRNAAKPATALKNYSQGLDMWIELGVTIKTAHIINGLWKLLPVDNTDN
ncbi:hypothetical protein [Corynebacterium callunae]|uniref:hypothetical protein n=1 Tax=Corynebacterium callunae TaxID=1721 RepID=UPI001FFF9CAE|nr:hypothetical protein [Corynebacterium callunae]MCK2200827.1 hypothetical protein [Corynebacterium callunae]